MGQDLNAAGSAGSSIGLDHAVAIIDAAFAAAAARSMMRVAVVVTDAGGDVRAAMRSDAQAAFAIDIAHAKARSALGFRMSTLKLAGFFGQAASSTIGITSATDGRFIPIGGGVAVVDRHGTLIGAAAVAGGLPEADDAVIRAALATVGFEALP